MDLGRIPRRGASGSASLPLSSVTRIEIVILGGEASWRISLTKLLPASVCHVSAANHFPRVRGGNGPERVASALSALSGKLSVVGIRMHGYLDLEGLAQSVADTSQSPTVELPKSQAEAAVILLAFSWALQARPEAKIVVLRHIASLRARFPSLSVPNSVVLETFRVIDELHIQPFGAESVSAGFSRSARSLSVRSSSTRTRSPSALPLSTPEEPSMLFRDPDTTTAPKRRGLTDKERRDWAQRIVQDPWMAWDSEGPISASVLSRIRRSVGIRVRATPNSRKVTVDFGAHCLGCEALGIEPLALDTLEGLGIKVENVENVVAEVAPEVAEVAPEVDLPDEIKSEPPVVSLDEIKSEHLVASSRSLARQLACALRAEGMAPGTTVLVTLAEDDGEVIEARLIVEPVVERW